MDKLSKIISVGSILIGVLIIALVNSSSHLILAILGAPLTLICFLCQFILGITSPWYCYLILYFIQYQLIAFILNKYRNIIKSDHLIWSGIVLMLGMATMFYLFGTFAIR